MRTLAADALQDLADVIKHAVVEHWLAELDVTEMAWAIDLRAHASLAKAVLVHGAHTIIVDTIDDWVAIITIE